MSYKNDRITGIPSPLPKDYDRVYSFTDWATNNPTDPVPGNQLDAEFNAVQQAMDETQDRLALIQRSDGALKNESVGLLQLKSEISIGVNSPTDWAAFTLYDQNDTVIFNNTAWYLCLESHTSSNDFNADKTAGKWKLLLDFTAFFTTEAEHWANYPEDQLVPEGDGVDDYSALHWARKSEASATSAAASAASAASDAASLNIDDPATGSVADQLRVNGAQDGYELFTPTAEAEAATAGTLAKRTAAGRLKAADPSAAGDVATKGSSEQAAVDAINGRIADEPTAIAGVNNTELMTSLRTKQQMAAINDFYYPKLETFTIGAVASQFNLLDVLDNYIDSFEDDPAKYDEIVIEFFLAWGESSGSTAKTELRLFEAFSDGATVTGAYYDQTVQEIDPGSPIANSNASGGASLLAGSHSGRGGDGVYGRLWVRRENSVTLSYEISSQPVSGDGRSLPGFTKTWGRLNINNNNSLQFQWQNGTDNFSTDSYAVAYGVRNW